MVKHRDDTLIAINQYGLWINVKISYYSVRIGDYDAPISHVNDNLTCTTISIIWYVRRRNICTSKASSTFMIGCIYMMHFRRFWSCTTWPCSRRIVHPCIHINKGKRKTKGMSSVSMFMSLNDNGSRIAVDQKKKL